METNDARNCKVCVTGGAGYIGSWLVKKLLQKGYTVHATLRNLGSHLYLYLFLFHILIKVIDKRFSSEDKSKVGLLKSFPDAETRLFLFEADLYSPDKFQHAIQGCEFVFHVAALMGQADGSLQVKSMADASVAAAKSLATFCVKTGTVRRLIYTGSLVCASPIMEDGTGFKDSIDETCWTSPNLSSFDYVRGYVESKMQTEKEIMNYGRSNNGDDGGLELEVIALDIGVVAGDTLLPKAHSSLILCVCQLINNDFVLYKTLRDIEDSLGKIPIVHIDDVGEAQIFCMEKPSIKSGRFFCAGCYVSSAEIAHYYLQNNPEFHVKQEYLDVPNREIKWSAMKLIEQGFEYKYDMKMILDDSVKCAMNTGYLPQ